MATMTMMLAVAADGAMGALLRYRASLVTGNGISVASGLLATLVVHVAGSAILDCVAGSVAAGMALPETWRGFLAIGIIGALTTSSGFAPDAGQLGQTKGVIMVGAYLVVLVVLSLLAFGAMIVAFRHSGIWQ